MQLNLLHKPTEYIELAYGQLIYVENFLSCDQAQFYFDYLKDHLDWGQDKIRLFGKTHLVPRLHAFYGDKGISYTYSKIELNAKMWLRELLDIKSMIQGFTGRDKFNAFFNCVLCNFYRNGEDYAAWHADDEFNLGVNPTIASISLGETRRFKIKSKNKHNPEKFQIDLTSGSLLIMQGAFQHHYLHQLAKSTVHNGVRINLTFRLIK
jgi:alkylated DNA repair dioxygenase AlkB